MASDAPYPPSSSPNAADSYIGSLISLISRYEIRYEGVLYLLDVKDSTIGLKNVKSYGTEGRKKDGPQIPPSEKVYEYILFRGSDIKDLQVMSSPPAKAEEHLYSDPAIIQTHCTGMPFSSSPVTVGGKNQFHDTPAVISRVKPEESHPYQSGMLLSSSNQTESAQSLAASHILTPISSQSYNGTFFSHIDGVSCSIPSVSQPSVLVPWTVQNQFQLYQPQSSAASVLMTTSEVINPKPSSVTSFIEYPRLSSSQTPMQLYNSPVVSSSNVNIPLSIDSPLIPSNNVATPPAISNHSFPDHSMTYPASSFGPMSGPPLTPPPSIVAPNELTQPGNSVLSQMQKLYPDNVVNYAMPAKAGAFSSISSQTPREPLQALPTSASQQSSSVPFTEEFNFEAMNEKFKKDEVWSALGRFDNKDRAETEDSSVSLGFGSRAGISLTGKPNTTLAYKKDDFFDTISCNSLSQGTRTGQNRFSERMKMDVETFGGFGFRPPHQYGVSGTGRVQNFHGQYSWGRQYCNGGRECGGNMP